jgi:signal recognition particle subunit SRP19
LYALISAHLKENPTTEEVAMKVQVPGAPTPDPSKEYPKPAVPRGVKMGSILPYYSPALSGGGVSDNFLQDMMAQMGGGMPGVEAGPSGGNADAKPKKQKQKKVIIRG